MGRIRNVKTHIDEKVKGIKRKRKELLKKTKDQSRNIERASEETGAICIVCGNSIQKGQSIRTMPKDKNCQEVRLYHLKTCGPGSTNWKKFKDNGKKIPKKSFQWSQLSFNWKEGKR